jgi:hypothetical protein
MRFRYQSPRISAVLFHCHEEQQYPIGGQILKSITSIEHSSGLSGNVIHMMSLASKKFWCQFNIRMVIFIVSRFTRSGYMRRFAGTQLPRITRAPVCINDESEAWCNRLFKIFSRHILPTVTECGTDQIQAAVFR